MLLIDHIAHVLHSRGFSTAKRVGVRAPDLLSSNVNGWKAAGQVQWDGVVLGFELGAFGELVREHLASLAASEVSTCATGASFGGLLSLSLACLELS